MNFFAKIRKHVENWTEGYLWVPVTLFAIWFSGKLVEWMSGHPAKENVDWLVDYSALAYKCVWIVVFTSVFKQATGAWLTKEEKFAHPYLATIGDIKILVSFIVFAYVWLH